jgi:hypothetical protein
LTLIHIHFHIKRVSGPILSLCVRTDALYSDHSHQNGNLLQSARCTSQTVK